MSAATEVAFALGGKANGSGWMAPCPCHMDNTPSLSIGEGSDGRVLLKCHAGCSQDELVAKVRDDMGLDLSGRRKPAGRVVEYDYRDRDGAVRYRVVRREPKDFRQCQPDVNGGWKWSMAGVRQLPYRLPELLAEPNKPVFVVEGEKDADRLASEGLVATTNAGGGGKWRPELNIWLKDRDVVILPDNDEPGWNHADDVSRKLRDVARRVRVLELPGLAPKGDVSDWLNAGHTVRDLRRLAHETPTWEPDDQSEPQERKSSAEDVVGVALDDFRAYMPTHSYIFAPTGDMWPAGSVNARIPPVTPPEGGKPTPPSVWLDTHRAVEQMTWAPGEPQIVADRLTSHAGWIERPGVACFNLYRPPAIVRGSAGAAKRWLDHVERVFPDDSQHVVRFLAHRVQRPQEKINHALVLGGKQGVGKDTILEPVKQAIGPWNWHDIAPSALSEAFNPFAKSVILRINEGHDLGELNRYQFYEAIKSYTAAPPDVLRVNEKHLRQFYVPNVCGVVITTNHKTDGLYLPPDDRRHFVVWSPLKKEDFDPQYWTDMWSWYEAGGFSHVAAYLAQTSVIAEFDPKRPPQQTEAWWAIVNAGRAPEDADLDATVRQMRQPVALTVEDLIEAAPVALGDWLRDRNNRRNVPRRLEGCGYTPVRNGDAKDGLWKIDGERCVAYSRSDMAAREQIEAVRLRQKEGPVAVRDGATRRSSR